MRNYWLKEYTDPEVRQANSHYGKFSGKWFVYKYEKDEWEWYQRSLEWWDGCQQADPCLKKYYLQRNGKWVESCKLNKTNESVMYFDSKEELIYLLGIS